MLVLYYRRCDVVNRGFIGYNTRWMKMLLPRLLPDVMAADVVAVTLFLGANDSTLLEVDETQHIPLDEYRANLQDMLRYLEVSRLNVQIRGRHNYVPWFRVFILFDRILMKYDYDYDKPPSIG